MSDLEEKTKESLAHVESVLKSDELKATGWIKVHILYIACAVCLLLGFVAGRVTH